MLYAVITATRFVPKCRLEQKQHIAYIACFGSVPLSAYKIWPDRHNSQWKASFYAESSGIWQYENVCWL